MADYYTLLTNAGIAYETACKAAGLPIKLSQISVGDGGGTVYNPAATATALKREVWRGPLNALFQDEKNPSWLLAEVTIPPEVGGWYVREAGLWTDTGILYAIVKYPESFKPILATSGSGKEFYIRSIFETSNASLVTLLIDDTVVKATRAWVMSYLADELGKLDSKQSVRAATTGNIVLSGAQTIDGIAVVAGDRVLVKAQSLSKDNGIYVAANGPWSHATDADTSAKVTSGLIVSVEEGALLANTIWQLITDGLIVLGTTTLTFQNITQGFAPINSPALINPTANTPLQFDISQALVNTHFLKRRGVEYSSFTSNNSDTTLTAIHVGGFHIFSKATPLSAILPPTAEIAQGATITLASSGVGETTLKAASGDVLFTSTGLSGPLVMAIGDTAEFIKLENQWRLIGGSLDLQFAGVMSSPSFKTRAQFDSSNALATTEFVQRALGNTRGYVSYSQSTVLTVADIGKYVMGLTTGMIFTLPNPTLYPSGVRITIQAAAGAAYIIVNSPTVNFGGSNGSILGSTSLQLASGVSSEFISNGSGWNAIGGSGSALLASSGFVKHANGLIEQWVTGGSDANGNMTVSLPIQFTTEIIGGLADEGNPTGWGTNSATVWAFDITASTLSIAVARSRRLYASGPVIAAGTAGRIRIWGR